MGFYVANSNSLSIPKNRFFILIRLYPP
jgi:hypothetical protein